MHFGVRIQTIYHPVRNKCLRNSYLNLEVRSMYEVFGFYISNDLLWFLNFKSLMKEEINST